MRISRRLKTMHSDRATNAKKGIKGRTLDGKKSKVVLSMFRGFQKGRGAGVCQLES